MHINLPSDDSGNRQVFGPDEVLGDLLADPVWQALQGGLDRLAPHISEEEVRSLLEKLHEHKMMEQLQDLLKMLPEESQQLLDHLQESRLLNA
ncbi:MAG: hypothetical protein ACAI44_33160 [Candidatus Sericytochromatia bacterium]